MDKTLHIICLTVPYPVDYGGVFDLFYKLQALQQQGVKIHLHCFDYGRGEQQELNKYCESVNYYPRKSGLAGMSVRYPYIVYSRKNEELLERLSQDNFPIFMEGVHCSYLLHDKRFEHRKCFMRMHNIEHVYYRHLYHNSTSPLKKAYFLYESRQLKHYEKSITARATFWSVTEKDAVTYRAMGCKTIDFLPLFLPAWQVKTLPGNGSFCLYHGDLSVAENERAASWLLEHVFSGLSMPFVIAGKNPSRELYHLCERKNTNCIVANPNEAEMQDLIAKAHINILPAFNDTGIKLKLINALFNGRHCLVNPAAVEGSGLEDICHIAQDAASFKSSIGVLYQQPVAEQEIEMRHALLDNMFDNKTNAWQMVKWIWGEGY